MQTRKKTSNYRIIKKLNASDVAGGFNSVVKKVVKKAKRIEAEIQNAQKFKNIWFLKNSVGPLDATAEVLAQELFRLIIPNQPKTRLIKNRLNIPKFVASKEVPGFRSFDDMSEAVISDRLRSGIYHGLGEILVMSLLVNETDLRNGNVGINCYNQVIKIDGDHCFSHIIGYETSHSDDVQTKDVAELPYIKHYYAFHWLDWIAGGEECKKQVIFTKALANSAAFNHEINYALLKVLILPDELLKVFVSRICPTEEYTNIYFSELIKRRDQIKAAAFQRESFCSYLFSTKASNDFEEYLVYLKNFKTTGKHDLAINNYKDAIANQFESLIMNSFQVPNKSVEQPAAPRSKSKLGFFAKLQSLLGIKTAFTTKNNSHALQKHH